MLSTRKPDRRPDFWGANLRAGMLGSPSGPGTRLVSKELPISLSPAGCWSWTKGRWQRAAALLSCWPGRACSIGWHRSQAWSEPDPSTLPPRQPGKTCHALEIPVTWGSSAESRPLCPPGLGGKWQGKWTIITDPGGCSNPQGRPDQIPSGLVHPGPKVDSGSQPWLPIGPMWEPQDLPTPRLPHRPMKSLTLWQGNGVCTFPN